MAQVRWTMDALHDLQQHLEYLYQIDPLLAHNVVRKVRRAVGLLEQFPNLGRFDAELGVREYWVPGTRLILIHVASDEVVEIIAAFHTSRDPDEKTARR